MLTVLVVVTNVIMMLGGDAGKAIAANSLSIVFSVVELTVLFMLEKVVPVTGHFRIC